MRGYSTSARLHRGYAGYDGYRYRDAYFICDVCGQRFRRSQMLVRWDNARVDAQCNDPRPPQMFPPEIWPEGIPFPDARPPQDNPDRLTDDTTLQSVTGGFMVSPPGQYHNGGQNQLPGALSPMSIESSPGSSPGGGVLGPPTILEDDITFLTGRAFGSPQPAPSILTASISQTLPPLTQQAIASDRTTHPVASVNQTFGPLSQSLTGSSLGTRTASIAQTLPGLTQAGIMHDTGTGETGSISQTLHPISQSVHASSIGTRTGAVSQTFARLLQAGTILNNPTRCAYGSAYADGCPGSPTGNGVQNPGPGKGLYQNPNFFTYARQSGQAPYVTRPPWNVAGVDYPVGIPSNITLLDPVVSVPSGFTYYPTGSTAHGPLLQYSGSGGSVTLDSYDFSLHGGVVLVMGNPVGGSLSDTITIRNCKFVAGPNVIPQNYYVFLAESAICNLLIENCYFDGQANANNYPNSDGMVNFGGGTQTGTVTLQYNAFLRSPGRFVETHSTGAVLDQFNYYEGMVYDTTGDVHGEVFGHFFPAGQTTPSDVHSFNTVLQPAAAIPSLTCAFFISNGWSTGTIALGQADHNTVIVNLMQGAQSGSACAQAGVITYGHVYFTDNFIDKTGSFSSFGSDTPATTPTTFSGNVNMVTGAAITAYNSG